MTQDTNDARAVADPEALMITKTFFLTQEIRAIRTKSLRQKKSFRDHVDAPACQLLSDVT
jgi:hypothetical protein